MLSLYSHGTHLSAHLELVFIFPFGDEYLLDEQGVGKSQYCPDIMGAFEAVESEVYRGSGNGMEIASFGLS